MTGVGAIDISPLLDSGPIIASHALAAFAAMALGGIQLTLDKGTRLHRKIGYLWVGLLGLVAASSFLIHEFRWIGPFSAIHLLSALTLVTLWRGVAHARHGRLLEHKRAMVALYCIALLLTGLFTLLPGRTMHAVLIGA